MFDKERNLISDHLKASCFIICDGVYPSGKQRGYILRRLIRRSFSACLKLKIDILNPQFFKEIIESVISIYDQFYPELKSNKDKILEIFISESHKYHKSIETGKKQWEKIFSKYSIS